MILLLLDRTKQTVKIDASTVEIEERGVKLRLTVVDTPGFGDAIDNTDWYLYMLNLLAHYTDFFFPTKLYTIIITIF